MCHAKVAHFKMRAHRCAARLISRLNLLAALRPNTSAWPALVYLEWDRAAGLRGLRLGVGDAVHLHAIPRPRLKEHVST